jgi:hypothetical protein
MDAGELWKQTPKKQIVNRSQFTMNLSGKRAVFGHNSEKQIKVAPKEQISA